MEEEVRKNVIEGFLQDVYILADIDYQTRVWIDRDGIECDSMDTRIGYFLEVGEAIIESPTEFHLTPKRSEKIKALYKKVEDFDRQEGNFKFSYFDHDVIYHDDWKQIIILAKEVMDAFNNPFKMSASLIQTIDFFTRPDYQREEWRADSKHPPFKKGIPDSKTYIDYAIQWSKHFASCQKKYGYSDEQVEILNKLHQKLKAFPYDKSNLLEFIDSDEWKEIGELSKQALELFKDVPAW